MERHPGAEPEGARAQAPQHGEREASIDSDFRRLIRPRQRSVHRLPLWFTAIVVAACVMPTLSLVLGIDWGNASDSSRFPLAPEALELTTAEYRDVTRGLSLHALLEWSAICAAVFSALLAFISFRMERPLPCLLIGFGLLTAGLNDVIHTLVEGGLLSIDSDISRSISYTWTISRLCNASVPVLALVIFYVHRKSSSEDHAWFGAAAVSILAICCVAVLLGPFDQIVLSRPGTGDGSLLRGRELRWDAHVLAIYFASSVLIYPLFQRILDSSLGRALWLSTLPNMVAQLHMILGFSNLFDHHDQAAHFMKLTAYLVQGSGLVFDYVRMHERSALTTRIARQQFRFSRILQARLESLLEGLPVSIVAVDEDGKIRFSNAEAQRTLGYPEGELIGLEVERLVPEHARHAHAGYRAAYMLEGLPRSMGENRDLHALRKDGSRFPVRIALSPIETDRGRWVVAAVMDVSELDRQRVELLDYTERLERSNADLESFAYVASHDLKEPVRSITSFAQLLRARYSKDLDDRGAQYLGYIIEGGLRMGNLIDDLLEYARCETAVQPPQIIDADEVLSAVLENLSARIHQTGTIVACESLPLVLFDPIGLSRVFRNLITNAMKFNDSEPPRIRIFEKASDKGRVCICVSDNGIGIDQNFQDRIFGIFTRLHSRERFSGTGIGLAITRRLVERHGGRIWLESTPGEGTTFYLDLETAEDESGKPDFEI